MYQFKTIAVLALGLVSYTASVTGQAPTSTTEPEPMAPLVPPMPTESKVKQINDFVRDAGRVSLGISVVKPTEALYSQLPQLPKGCGFLIQSLKGRGAAEKAGLQALDLIWKLGDQLLINESQMMVLLSQYKPGDHVTISYFRAGKQEQAEVHIQKRQPSPRLDLLAMAAASSTMPMRVISYEERSASISDKMGTATLTYREGKPWLHVESDKGVETFNNYVVEAAEIARVPAIWKSRLPVLVRSLEESARLRKLPRVRHVPRQRPVERIAEGP